MVKFHQTVDTYLCPGSARTTSNRKLMEQALMGAKILMIAGHEALRVESLDTHIRGIFERYFGPCTQSKKLGVGRTFAKMQKLVTHEKDIDVTFHLGTDHLSGKTTVWLPPVHAFYPCVLDLTKAAYDSQGNFVGQDSTWRAHAITRFDPGVRSPTAYCVMEDDNVIGSAGGTHVFMNPETLTKANALAPFIMDPGSRLEIGDSFNKIMSLPGTVFHEFCHSVLLGPVGERLTDMMVTPAMLGHQKYLLGDKAIETDVAHCVYGEELCATAAKLSHELSWKVLRSAESYLCFALSVFMFRNGFDFMEGHLKNTPLSQHSTESNLWTESTLADCPYRVGGEQ